MMNSLPPLISHYLDKWALVPDGDPFETNSSWLAYVSQGSARAVLKIPKPASDERHGARALRAFGDRVSVRVLEEDSNALLLERIWPGTTLTAIALSKPSENDARATHILCDTILALHSRIAPLDGWQTIETWGEAFARARKLPPHRLLTAEWLDRGSAEYFELCRQQSKPILLHGDLHHDNVLFDETRGWLSIDPKGVVGELAFETATALHNPWPHCDLYADAKAMEFRIGIFAERLALDTARIIRWCFAHALLSAAWHREDNSPDEEIAHMLRVAETAGRLLGK